MPNHFHFIISPKIEGLVERDSFGGKKMQELAFRIGVLTSSYSQAINKQNKTTGSIFQQKTKAKLIVESCNGTKLSYFEQCFHYIHRNPLVAKLVDDVAYWQWSSYPDYAGLRNGTLCNKEMFFDLTGLSSSDIVTRTRYILTDEQFGRAI